MGALLSQERVAIPKKSEPRHIAALDGLRGVAVLIVILHHVSALITHTGPLAALLLRPIMINGWVGVDLFFVLSGFLITRIVIQTRNAENRATVFYARRALRIFPIYYLSLFVVLSASHFSSWLSFLLPYAGRTDVVLLLLFGQSWIPFFHGGASAANIVGHFWSLGVEENFYFIWPWLLWLSPARFHLRLCVLGVALSLAIRVVCVSLYGPNVWAYLATSGGVDCLLVGSALGLLSLTFGRVPVLTLAITASVGLAILLSLAVYDHRQLGRLDSGLFADTVVITAYGLIFGALVGSAQYSRFWLTRWMDTGWLKRIGTYSYGMYVYHVPLLWLEYHFLFERTHFVPRLREELLYLALVFVSTYLVAWASFVWIEAPILRLKSHFRPSV